MARSEETDRRSAMDDLLGFNPNRGLSFHLNRDLEFDEERDLSFEPGRDLGFKAGRDLGFGKRGPVFRGYVCPVCGAAVTPEQPSCTQCGAVFEPKRMKERRPEPPPPPPEEVRALPSSVPTPPRPQASRARVPPPPPGRAYPLPPKRIDAHNCTHCGARVATSDQFCWNCGNRMYSAEGR